MVVVGIVGMVGILVVVVGVGIGMRRRATSVLLVMVVVQSGQRRLVGQSNERFGRCGMR